MRIACFQGPERPDTPQGNIALLARVAAKARSGGASLRAEWKLRNDFVVGHSGNLGRAHEFEPILAAIQTIEHGDNHSTHPSIRWLFIGGGHAFERLKEEVNKRGLTSVVFRPYQPRSQLAQSLSAADVHVHDRTDIAS